MSKLEGIYLKVNEYVVSNCNEEVIKNWREHLKKCGETIVEWAALKGYLEVLKYMIEDCGRNLTKNLCIRVSGDENLSTRDKIKILEYMKTRGYVHEEGLINWAIILDDIELLRYGEEYLEKVKEYCTYQGIMLRTNNKCTEYIKNKI